MEGEPIFPLLLSKIAFLQRKIISIQCVKTKNPNVLEVCDKILEMKKIISEELDKLTKSLQELKGMNQEMEVMLIEVSHLSWKMEQLTDQLNHLDVTKMSYRTEIGNASNDDDNKENKDSFNVESGSYESFSPMDCAVAHKQRQIVKVQPKYLAMDITYITDEEWKTVPRYMLGRLTKEAINLFIDKFNTAVTKKYRLLSKSTSSLKSSEFTLYNVLKKQQNMFKGQTFVTEDDIAREMENKKLEKKSYNLLTILRHLKRITETRHEGRIIYFLT